MGPGRDWFVRWLSLWSAAMVGTASAAGPVEVTTELTALAQTHGFEVRGLAETEGGWGRCEGDALYERLRSLLADYDHVILTTAAGSVRRVLILGEKGDWSHPSAVESGMAGLGDETGDEEIVLPIERQGAQRSVAVRLEGENGARIQKALLIDTGADFVVLPRSFLPRLDIEPDSLRDQEVQTANGKVQAKLGKLSGLWLGETRLAQVEAAFIEDQMLGGNALLGMNVLGRYRLTIDDKRNELRLQAHNAE